MIMLKNTKRIVKIPNSGQGSADNLPIEVPGLPSMAITFNSDDQRLQMSKNDNPYSVLKLENEDFSLETPTRTTHERLFFSPQLKVTQKTLHYVLETYNGLYEIDGLVEKCLELENYQAAAKISFLQGHYGDSLGFQLTAFKEYLDAADIKFTKETVEVIVVKSAQEDLNQKNLTYSGNEKSSSKIMSSSSSLDSIRQWGDDVEHQGGCESPCDFGDVQKNVTQYVQSLKDEIDKSPPVSSVSKLLEKSDENMEGKKIKTEVSVVFFHYNQSFFVKAKIIFPLTFSLLIASCKQYEKSKTMSI